MAPRNEERLQETCQRLAELKVSAFGVSEWIDAAHALSYVNDPIEIWRMQCVLWRTDKADATMIRGLSQIGDEAAQAVLAEVAAFPDPERSKWAVFALERLRSKAR